MRKQPTVTLPGVLGTSAEREVFLGFAPARVLFAASYADVLDEETQRGYQRRPNPQHSLDFRQYIQRPGSTTIPLTFNARPREDGGWKVAPHGVGATLELRTDVGKILTQVDCQHRLGHLNDLDTSLPFMCFLGLSEREEMEIFNTINSKAKGLSTSLLDFHAATLATNLADERPELFIAFHLHNDTDSPWYRELDLGGSATSGMHRRASLRTMQKAIKRFLRHSRILQKETPEAAARLVLAFWAAVAHVLSDAWSKPRKHLLNKGVGVYALMSIASDLYLEHPTASAWNRRHFISLLSDFLPNIDWTAAGDLQGLGGEGGVKQAVAILRGARKRKPFKVVQRG
jgi:DNA sulfur modification protein DndB